MNINAISEHMVPDELKSFLELQLPDVKKSSKKSKGFGLGLIDANFASAVQEATGFPCKSNDTVREILRGVRLHLPHFVKEVRWSLPSMDQCALLSIVVVISSAGHEWRCSFYLLSFRE
jgi:hypothetical protein